MIVFLQVTEDMALVARKLTAASVTAEDEEAVDPFADVDNIFPQEGWRRQKEDKEDGLVKQVCLKWVYRMRVFVVW